MSPRSTTRESSAPNSGARRNRPAISALVVVVVILIALAADAVATDVAAPRSEAVPSAQSGAPLPTFAPTPSAPPAAAEPATFDFPRRGSYVLYFGDSWTRGQAVAPGKGYVPVSAAREGWKAIRNGEGGTGYVNTLRSTGSVYPERVPSLPTVPAPKLIILQGGLNDARADPADIVPAALLTFAEMEQRFPGVPIVVVGPSTYLWPVPANVQAVDGALVRATDEADLPYISPLSEGWINGTNIERAISTKFRHPTAAGYKLYAIRLLESLHRLSAK